MQEYLNQKIKVVNIISDLNIGGAGRCLINYLKYHDRNQFEVSVILPKNSLLKPSVEAYDIACHEVDHMANQSFDLKAVKAIYSVLKSIRPDIVHTHASLSARVAARLIRGCKTVYTRHSVFPPSRFQKSITGKCLNRIIALALSDKIIAVSQAAKDNIVEVSVPESKIQVVLNGVDAIEPMSEQEKCEVRRMYGIPDNHFIAGIIARLEAVKGHEDLLKAAKICMSQVRDIHFIIAGTGAEEERLKDLAKRMGLEQNVTFAGFVKEISQITNIIDINVNASYGTEATSLSLLEGMSLGKPSVVSDYGGNPYIVFNEINGLVYKTRDYKGLSDAILRLYQDRDLYERLSVETKSIFDRQFTAVIMSRNIEKVYCVLINQELAKNNAQYDK